MSTTNYILLAILAVLLFKFFPSETAALAGVALAGLALYACYWLVARFPAWRRKRAGDKRQTEQDERDFWEWDKKHNAIRAKFDPQGQWNEATSTPHEYQLEVLQLNKQYRSMLQRRNGWSSNDFIDSDA